jgi:hypothetical protein
VVATVVAGTAAAPPVAPAEQGGVRTPTAVSRPRQLLPDLSAPLPVVTLTPTPVRPTPTPEELPATLTPTPLPTATATVSPVVLVAAPTPTVVTPTPTSTEEPGGLLLPEGAVPDGAPAPVAAPRPPAAQTLQTPPAAPPPALRVLGLPEEPGVGGWFAPDVLWLGVPARSQFDGTPYAAANCGPSALGMVLEAYGLWMPTHELRLLANALQGSWGYDDGIALDYLAEIGARAGLTPLGLYEEGRRGYHRWTVDEVRRAVRDGYPVIVLTKYRLLPGNAAYGGEVNHYVVISGLIGDDFLYNDSAYGGGGGRALILPAAQLEMAWGTADIPHHAVAFAVGEERLGLVSPLAAVAGRGAPRRPPEESAARSLAGQPPAQEPARARRAPPDPAAAHREQLFDAVLTPASLLDTPLASGSAAPGGAAGSEPAAPLVLSEPPTPPAPSGKGGGGGRVGGRGGVGSQ